MGHGKLLFFGSKATHRRKNFENRTSFRYVSLRTKFYYITQLCEMELPRKFNFFPFFHQKNIFFFFRFLILHEKCVFLRYIMQKQLKNQESWRGAHKLQLQLMSPPSNFLIFELHKHDVPQKNTFFMQNQDSKEKKYF